MTAKLPLAVNAWGFTSAELAGLPPTLQAKPVSHGPFLGPLVVHARAAAAFLAAATANPLPDGSLARAVLYDPGESPPDGADRTDRAGFAAVIAPAEVHALADLLACPERFLMEEYAEDLPNSYLDRLQYHISGVAAENLPVPPPVKAHLAICATCRTAFDAAVTLRKKWQRTVFCPSPHELHTWMLGADLPSIAQHVADCPHCRTEVAALHMHKSSTWLILDIVDIKALLLAGLPAAGTASSPQLLRGLLLTFLTQFQPAGVQAWRQPAAGAGGQAALDPILSSLLGGSEIKLVRERRELVLRLDPAENAVVLHSLIGSAEPGLDKFALELWHDDNLHWRGESEGGAAVLPLERLQEAIDQGAVRLVVRQAP